jgi:hypothetical protein
MPNSMTTSIRNKETQISHRAMLGMHYSKETMKQLAKYLSKTEIGRIASIRQERRVQKC